MSTKVTFNTTPSGANVEIRDRTGAPWARHITPFTVHLENGTWFFNISKHGYRTRNFAKTFYYPDGHTLSMHEVLEKEIPALEPIHNYTVTTVPSGATVQILQYRTDTILHTGTSPVTFRLRRGNYDKNIIKAGFRTVRATFIAYKDETRNITLSPLEPPIRIPTPPREPPIRIPPFPPREPPIGIPNWFEENKIIIIIVAIVLIIIILLK